MSTKKDNKAGENKLQPSSQKEQKVIKVVKLNPLSSYFYDPTSGLKLTPGKEVEVTPNITASKRYKFAVTKVPQCIMEVLEQGNVTAEEVKYFILHQANMRIIQSVAKRLKVSEDKFPISLDTCGNVSAARIPILLDKVNKEGLLKRGDKLVLAGFGGGLTWGATVIEW